MTRTSPIVTLAPRDCDAVLFDLDGVLTRTASVHAVAWKNLFDDFLRRRAAESGEAFVPFDIEVDYRRYVDGKPRRDGVVSFPASRGILLPEDPPPGDPDAASVESLAARKDLGFLEALEHGASRSC
jgi:alpha,alpha-trehalase